MQTYEYWLELMRKEDEGRQKGDVGVTRSGLKVSERLSKQKEERS